MSSACPERRITGCEHGAYQTLPRAAVQNIVALSDREPCKKLIATDADCSGCRANVQFVALCQQYI
jgi:hypothetical protein